MARQIEQQQATPPTQPVYIYVDSEDERLTGDGIVPSGPPGVWSTEVIQGQLYEKDLIIKDLKKKLLAAMKENRALKARVVSSGFGTLLSGLPSAKPRLVRGTKLRARTPDLI